MDTKKEAQWYMDAVRSDLILNQGMTAEDAEIAIEKYKLKEKLEEYPEVQLHYGIASIVREMREHGCLGIL